MGEVTAWGSATARGIIRSQAWEKVADREMETCKPFCIFPSTKKLSLLGGTCTLREILVCLHPPPLLKHLRSVSRVCSYETWFLSKRRNLPSEMRRN